MARGHGRILASIWTDPDFIALPARAQRLYLFLLSQPDLNHAGLIPRRTMRWAAKAGDVYRNDVDDDLATLETARFIVSDEETEEVLVRTLVRNDGVYKQPKVMLRLREDAKQIESPLLRRAFRAELDRLPLHELSDNPTGRDGDGPSTRQAVQSVVDALREDFREPTERVADTPSDTPSDGDAEPTYVRAGALPQPPTPSPLPPAPVPPTAGSAIALRDDHEPTAQSFVAEWIEHCPARPPGRVIGQVAKELKSMLDEGIEPDRVRAGLAEWNGRGLHPSTLPSVVHEVGNRKPRTNGKQAETDALFERAARRMGVVK